MNSLNQQQYLADFAPKQSLDKYAKGADPRVISGIVALSEMQQQAAERQRASLAAGAAQGQMPTVRDKIMQMFQQANQPRQQPQQQPNPMMQRGIMAQAHPQMQTAPMPQEEAPQEAQMYHGGVARLPINNQMFGYANGGIIAFKEGDEVPRPIGEETPLSPEERTRLERELAMRVIGERARAEGARDEAPAPTPERESEMMRAVKTPFRAIGEGIKSLYTGSPNATPSPMGVADQDLGAAIMNTERAAPRTVPAPARDPRQAGLEKLHQLAIANGSSSMSPSRAGIAQTLPPAPAKPAPVTSAAAPSVTPSSAPGAKPPTVDQLLAQQQQLLQTTNAPATGPQLPEKSITEKATDFLQAQEDYVRKTGDSEAAKKLMSLYDKAEKRALADDDAQAAQRAADARNNLATFLINTRGSSLAAGAGRADAALQPLLAEQKKTNAEYRKYSYERDMNREKARVEAIAAEDARKRGDFAKAIEHEQKERNYTLEAQKAKDLADHYKRSDYNQLLNIQATRESAKEGHLTQLQVAQINKAAQMAGFNKPSESERVRAEYQRILKEGGQKAADAFLADEQKIRAAVGGVKYEGTEKDNTRAYYQSLYQDPNYSSAEDKIRRLEAKTKRTPADEQALSAARAYVQRKQEEVRRDFGMAGGAGAAPQRVTSQEEYAKLPSGTRFIAPDGSLRTKP